MKKFLKDNKIVIVVSMITMLIMILLLTVNNTNIINRIEENVRKSSSNKSVVEYEIMAKDDTSNELEIMINVENENGLDTIQIGDFIINCNGKHKISIDRILAENSNTTIIVKGLNEEAEKLVLIPTTEYTALMRLTEMIIDGEEKNKVELTALDEDSETYYSVDNGETWNLLLEEATLYDIDVDKMVINKMTDNVWEVKRKDEKKLVGYDTVTEVVETIIIKTGYYKVMVQDEDISMHAYVEDGDLIIQETTEYGDSGDVATASTYAQNMVVLKVNGNLTVNEGATLTAYGTSYGGPKGMYIYSTGTLQNNGTITMTARGAKAEGENVYLWKNEDGSYEYVPAAGASGASARTGSASNAPKNGYTGNPGENRMTGGGGSGGAAGGASGAGAQGTSYSGGSGSGGSFKKTAGSAAGNGGAGGSGAGSSSSTNVGYKCRRRSRKSRWCNCN